jgi:iron-sulfur cluster assembly protein
VVILWSNTDKEGRMTQPFVSLTPTAIENLKQLLSDNDMAGHGLRFGVQGGGCSGYSYLMEFEESPQEGDITFSIDGVSLFLAPLKREFLRGVVIDFVDELIETGFKIHNPNVDRACGCGESFDIPEGKGATQEAGETTV